jgi:hypothetical protein
LAGFYSDVSFLPLAGTRPTAEYEPMDAFAVEEMVQERRGEVYRMRTTDRIVGSRGVPAWRRRAGRALASLAVTLGVPPADRPTSRRRIGDALCFDPPC